MRVTKSGSWLLVITVLIGTVVPESYVAALTTPLVTTEAFWKIDDGDASANPRLIFGQTLNETLTFDRVGLRFHLSRSLFVGGSVTATGGLISRTTVSGASLTFMGGNSYILGNTSIGKTLGANAKLDVSGTISGSALVVANTINGAGLAGCWGTANKLVWSGSTMRFGCQADQTGGGGGGSPGGSTTQVQYNNAGAFAGISGFTSNGTTVEVETQASIPAAPADGAKLFTFDYAGEMPYVRIASQRAWNLVDPILGGHFACLVPGTGPAPVSLGLPHTAQGTVSHTALSNGSLSTTIRRMRFASTTTAGNSAGTRANLTMVGRGSAAGRGGFVFFARFLHSTALAQQRTFVGLDDTTAVIGNVNPSTLTNVVYVGMDSAQTTLRVCSNDNAGTATCTDLGANFPANSTTAVYDVWFYGAPNGANIQYYVERLDSAFTANGTISAAGDLPQNTVFLAPQVWTNNGTTAAAAQIELGGYCVMSDI